MKYLHYIMICLLGLIAAACSDADAPDIKPAETGIRIEGDKVLVSAAVSMPGFKEVSSRSFSDEPDLSALRLYVIEFVDNGSPLVNTFSALYRPTFEELGQGCVIFDITLNKTDQPRILHFVAVADDNLAIPTGGVEASVMTSLTSEQTNDAYWRRITFPDGYCTLKTGTDGKQIWEVNSDLYSKFGVSKEVSADGRQGDGIKLVRNFAKITVGIDPNASTPEGVTGFTLEGFMIVNTPQKGSMVPYSAPGQMFPEFLDENDNPLPYLQVAATYGGFSPANTLLGNQITSQDAPIIPEKELAPFTDSEGKEWKCLPSEYTYERPFSNLSRTYIIIRGTYHNSVTNQNNLPSYYKLDLGANDENGIFRYYGLLRNYNYFIRIKGVNAPGYPTAAAAATGTVYNNVSFDIDTDHLINLSDGTDMLRVNLTTAVITDADSTLVFRYAYKKGILEANNGTFNNDLVDFIGLEPGSVIKSVKEIGDEADNNNVPWRTVEIACDEPTNLTKTQEFTIVNKETGLGRTITLVSHLKWNFENLCEFARIWENYPETYRGLTTTNPITNFNNSTYQEKCGTEVGSQFTIFFDIPDNIPEALFPLVFTLESDLQGLENEPMGTIVVAPGPSLFEGNHGENRIQYQKSVTWTEYNSPLRMDVRDDNGTMLGDPNEGAVTHRVRCRFRTIETVANGTYVTVAIANPNFNQAEIGFTRVESANSLTGPGLVIP